MYISYCICCFSLSVGFGALICFGSYNPVKNNVAADAILIGVINCGTSVFAAIVVYSVLGFREVIPCYRIFLNLVIQFLL